MEKWHTNSSEEEPGEDSNKNSYGLDWRIRNAYSYLDKPKRNYAPLIASVSTLMAILWILFH